MIYPAPGLEVEKRASTRTMFLYLSFMPVSSIIHLSKKSFGGGRSIRYVDPLVYGGRDIWSYAGDNQVDYIDVYSLAYCKPHPQCFCLSLKKKRKNDRPTPLKGIRKKKK